MQQVEFLKATVIDKGKFKIAEVVYKVDGKPRTIGVPSFNEDVFNVVTNAKMGEILDLEFVKNEKGYWSVKSASATGGSVDPSAPDTQPKSSPGAFVKKSPGNFETPEERAKRQVYIVRQSSLTTAIAYLQSQGKIKFELADVKKVAKELEQYVFE